MSRAILMSLLLAACVETAATDLDAPCEGKCDGASAKPLASCWIVPGSGSDPFFIVDELVCARRTDAMFDVVTINALSAGNDSGGEILDATTDAPVTILRVPRDRGYPLRVKLQIVDSTPRVNSVLPSSLTTEASIAAPDAASAESPLSWRVPFQVGEVILDSHLDQGALRIDYSLDLSPFVDARGASTLAIHKSAELSFGRQVRFELPSRGGDLAAAVGGAPITLPGFGHFALSAEGVAPVAAATGMTLVECTSSETESELRAVRCHLASSELASITATASSTTTNGPTSVTLAGDTEVAIGEFPASAFPLTVTVKATLSSFGATVLDPAVAGREVELAVTIPSTQNATVTGLLDLDLWSVTVTCAEELCMIDRDAFVLPLPAPGQWASRVQGDNVINLGNGDTTTFVFASPSGQRGFDGKRLLLVDANLDEQAIRVDEGVYRLDRTGLTPMM